MARRPMKKYRSADDLPGNPVGGDDLAPIVRPSGISSRNPRGLAYRIRNIGNSLFADIVLPVVKSTILDFISSGASMMIFGEGERRGGMGRGAPTAYNKPYTAHSRGLRGGSSSPIRYARDIDDVFSDIYYRSQEDAELVLGKLMERVHDYGHATVGDLYSLSGYETSYTHQRWGWRDLRGVRAYPTPDGWLISLPDVMDLH